MRKKILAFLLMYVLISCLPSFGVFPKVSAANAARYKKSTGTEYEYEFEYINLLNFNKEISKPLFTSDDGLWAPGYEKSKKFYIKNNSSYSFTMDYIKIAMELKDITGKALDPDSESFEDFINFVRAKVTNSGDILYEGSFKRLLGNDGSIDGSIILKDIVNAYSEKEYAFTIKMDEEAGNSIQGLVCEFDIFMGFDSTGEDEPSITPTPIEPTPVPTEYPPITPVPTQPTPISTETSPTPDNPLLKPTITGTDSDTQLGEDGKPILNESGKDVLDITKDTSDENGDGKGLGNLPKTGHFVDRKSLFLLGGIITVFGFLLAYRGNGAKK